MAFTYKLEHPDGTPGRPYGAPAPGVAWTPCDTIPLGRDRKLRVVDTRLDEGTDGDPVSVLVVEPA